MNQTSDYELTVVIPVYNEQESLQDLFNALSSYKQKSSVKVCFLFVNDGSSDNSFNLIKQFCLSTTDFYYISLEKRSGLTGALKAGFSVVKSDWVGYMDADLQTFPDDFELLLKNGADPSINNEDLEFYIEFEDEMKDMLKKYRK